MPDTLVLLLIFSLGFVGARSDTSLFVYRHGSDTTYLLLYVDDIILIASSRCFIGLLMLSLQNSL
jgi:hypothetical protein